MKVRGYVVLGEKDEPEGYFVFEAGEIGDPNEGYRIAVRDWMFLTRRAAERALAFFADYRSVASEIHWWGGPVEPMEVVVGEEAIAMRRHHPWMMRIVDVPRALEARGYRRDLEARISFLVQDDRFEWNRGPFTFSLENGRARVEEGGTPAFTIDVRGLAPLFTGYSSPEELSYLDLLEADRNARAELAGIFAGPVPWMVDAF
jgi:predicted acetyltransferase